MKKGLRYSSTTGYFAPAASTTPNKRRAILFRGIFPARVRAQQFIVDTRAG